MLDRNNLKSSHPQGVGQPDFIGIGTPKAGTSWWYQLLIEHPDIRNNSFNVKETCYFCHPWTKEEHDEAIKNYEAGFAAQSNQLVGEWSTLYFSHPFALKRLISTYPNVKKILTLREPISCMKSWVSQVMRNRAAKVLQDDDESRSMYMLYDLIPAIYAQIMAYPEKLQWLKSQPKDRTLCLQYENNARQPRQQLDRTFDFLEIPSFCGASLFTKVNSASRSQKLEIILPESVENDLRRCGEDILRLCPEFDNTLWY
jgi:hypothetical protein